ncbi:MAG: DUF5677 domain-containing protein [Candidatus Methanofastidiosia archaeon]|jgi:hypothetical protein
MKNTKEPLFPNIEKDELFKELVKAIQEKGLSLDEVTPEKIYAITSETGDQFLQKLKSSISEKLAEHHKFRISFEERLNELWKEPFRLLEMLLIMSYELGKEFSEEKRQEAAREKDFVFYVLDQLHSRAILIGKEILTLLRSGYASGAHARWRTLHEIAVTAFFIKLHGNDVAERYLFHDSIQSYKAMIEYQKHSGALGYPPLTKEEIQKVKKLRDQLRNKLGKSFVKETYGWAAKALNKKKPRFSDMESAVNLSHLRPFYRLASHSIHANPKSVTFNLGIPEKGENIQLAGPSNTGMADPGHCTSISLLQISAAFLTLRTSFQGLVFLNTMRLLVDEIEEKFLEVHKLTENVVDEIQKKRKL